MLVDAFRITPRDDRSCRLGWTAPWPDAVSWIFLNGSHTFGPIVDEKAERLVKVPFAIQDVKAVEIHDFPNADIRPDPIHQKPTTRPTLLWLPVTDAVRYRIYHHIAGDADSLIYDKPALEGIERYEIRCPIKLVGQGGTWHLLRVEAVDAYGNESTRQSWAYFAMDLPPSPTGLAVEDGSVSGTYTFRLED